MIVNVSETCSCGAEITFNVPEKLVSAMLADWRTGHLHNPLKAASG